VKNVNRGTILKTKVEVDSNTLTTLNNTNILLSTN